MVLTLDPQKDASDYTRRLKGKICWEAPRSPPGVWIHKEQRAPSGCHQPIPMQSEGCYSQGAGSGGVEGANRTALTKPSCPGQMPLQSSLLENCRRRGRTALAAGGMTLSTIPTYSDLVPLGSDPQTLRRQQLSN